MGNGPDVCVRVLCCRSSGSGTGGGRKSRNGNTRNGACSGRPAEYAGYPSGELCGLPYERDEVVRMWRGGVRLPVRSSMVGGAGEGVWDDSPPPVCRTKVRAAGPSCLCGMYLVRLVCSRERRGIGREEGRRGSCGKKGLEREARKRAAVPVAVLRAGRSVFRLSVSVYAGACRRGGSRLPFFYRVGQPSGTPAGTVYGDGCLCPHACFGGGAEDKKKETRSGHKPSDRFSFTNLKLLT